ncbi:hypothetical protein ACH4E5_23095 [Streptomyces afghaniensis]|uniref:hypothetical protein n=1 Tax=Streptomyces afghaniensis TaxID=66865 RepID=UPI0037BC1A3A
MSQLTTTLKAFVADLLRTTGARLAQKPRIKGFLSRPGTLWFLCLFNGGAAVAMYAALDGTKGIAAAAAMGLISLGAAGGIFAGRRRTAHA